MSPPPPPPLPSAGAAQDLLPQWGLTTGGTAGTVTSAEGHGQVCVPGRGGGGASLLVARLALSRLLRVMVRCVSGRGGGGTAHKVRMKGGLGAWHFNC